MDSGTRVVLVTCPVGEADALAHRLVEAGVAACVNIVGPVRSVYRWRGAIESADEAQLLIKTAADRISDLQREVLTHHPYETPEILVLAGEAGHPPYIQWVLDSTRPVK